MTHVVERNIEALLRKQSERERTRGLRDRIAATITRFSGSLTFVYVHLAIVAAWVLINAGWVGLPKFDPTFVLLATIASVEAIFLSTFVLMTQNRMQADADRRADLDLQISLLTEHELTRLIKIVGDMAERMGMPVGGDSEVQEMQRDVAPEQVLDALERKKAAFRADALRTEQ
jgi:uncharacterized membrane protein